MKNLVAWQPLTEFFLEERKKTRRLDISERWEEQHQGYLNNDVLKWTKEIRLFTSAFPHCKVHVYPNHTRVNDHLWLALSVKSTIF